MRIRNRLLACYKIRKIAQTKTSLVRILMKCKHNFVSETLLLIREYLNAFLIKQRYMRIRSRLLAFDKIRKCAQTKTSLVRILMKCKHNFVSETLLLIRECLNAFLIKQRYMRIRSRLLAFYKIRKCDQTKTSSVRILMKCKHNFVSETFLLIREYLSAFLIKQRYMRI